VALSLFIIVVAVAVVATLVYVSHRQKRNPTSTILITAIGTVDQSLTPVGSVLVQGELWSARSASGETIDSGLQVKVESYRDGTLLVKRLLPHA
jgi:membrane-bound ClpP family serine protease